MGTKVHPYDQVVFLLQGGGALGAYQVGVCEILLKNEFNPNWVVGTSIGAINAALIAGSRPKDRIIHLKSFWQDITTPLFSPEERNNENQVWLQQWQSYLSATYTLLFGQNNFFTPRWFNPWFVQGATPAELSFYDTTVLRTTLAKYIDFDLINQQKLRLTLGAVSVADGEQIIFDNTERKIGLEHVMASGALPPGFPAIEIDGCYYWDGGVVSNTPLSIILREKSAQKLLCFMVNLFSHSGRLPETMIDVIKRKKELSFTSRHHEIINYLCLVHEYQHLIYRLNQKLKNAPQNDQVCQTIQKMEKLGHPTACNIIRFHYQDSPGETWTKDFEFSAQTQQKHRRKGNEDALCALRQPEWLELIPDDAGIVMHDIKMGDAL